MMPSRGMGAVNPGKIPPSRAGKRSHAPVKACCSGGKMAKGGHVTGAWTRKEGQNPKGGLNAKGRASYNKTHGAHLKAPQPEGGPRRDSFCARMKGMKRKLTGKKTANDPDSRINKSLRAWKC